MTRTESKGRCIAMWSGPRNISTAMMRSFENRPDTEVSDEPFYGYYLQYTGIEHPARAEILATMDADPTRVAVAMRRDPGVGRVHYQKHMTHHMVGDLDLAFLEDLDHAFLIRDPDEVVRSYARVRDDFGAGELGFKKQRRIFDVVCESSGEVPPVVEGCDVLADPETTLRNLCSRLRIDFDEGMLSWPAGARKSDGVWAGHWYAAVEASTGFSRVSSGSEALSDDQRRISDECRPHYEALRQHRLCAKD
jgi:Sulfotransferase domain